MWIEFTSGILLLNFISLDYYLKQELRLLDAGLMSFYLTR